MKYACCRFIFLIALSHFAPTASLLAQTTPTEAASSAQSGGGISGYMELHYNKVDERDAQLDFHRFVLLVAHSFSPRIRFVGELELEHAVVEGLEDRGELELEQAYLDFLLSRRFNIRAGMMLVPLGIINERHEPPVFNGVERPFVDSVIIPSTWFEAGVGVHGEIGSGLRYRVFAMAPLDAAGFDAAEGIRGGRQMGVESNVRHFAGTGRVEYLGIPHLAAGASFWVGNSGFSTPGVNATVRIGEVDARYHRGPLELRAQFARVQIGDAGRLNAVLQPRQGVSPNIASGTLGAYGEVAYRVWDKGPARDLVTFVRYENFDTQYRMPAGTLPLEQFDRDAWVVGASYYPDPDVVVKVDVIRVRNQSGIIKPSNSVNVGLGWWF